MSPGRDATGIAYSTFRNELVGGNVVEVTPQGDRINGVLRAPVQRIEEGDTIEVLLPFPPFVFLALVIGRRIFDTVTSGAEDDLRVATRLARKMVMSWGMSAFVGPFAADQPGEVSSASRSRDPVSSPRRRPAASTSTWRIFWRRRRPVPVVSSKHAAPRSTPGPTAPRARGGHG